MKNFKLFTMILIAASFVSPAALAKKKAHSSAKTINIQQDVDTLGGNKELMELAQSIKAQSRTRIVQDRIVDRRHRVELGMLYGGTFGGDAYVRTQNLGAALDYHISPRWSVGLRYYDYSNNLTDEGRRMFSNANRTHEVGGTAQFVDIDYPLNATMAVVNWYPIYGKTSFLDMGITQFDIYLLGGGGQIQLSSGSTGIYTAGMGIAAWINKSLSVRAEGRYQNYSDQLVGVGTRNLNSGVGSLGLGWIL